MKDIEGYALAVFAGLLASAFTGIGAAMAWFRGSKQKIHERINGVKDDMEATIERVRKNVEKVADSKASHDVRLERVETCQENTSASLVKLEAGQKGINEKIDNFYRDVMTALAKQ